MEAQHLTLRQRLVDDGLQSRGEFTLREAMGWLNFHHARLKLLLATLLFQVHLVTPEDHQGKRQQIYGEQTTPSSNRSTRSLKESVKRSAAQKNTKNLKLRYDEQHGGRGANERPRLASEVRRPTKR